MRMAYNTKQERNGMNEKGYVVLRANGEVELKKFDPNGTDDFFVSVRGNDIRCEMAEPVQVTEAAKGIPAIFFLCNENGYTELGDDPANVNVIGTWLYNASHDLPEVSYVLGDIVLCTETEGDDGLEFAPFEMDDAVKIASYAKLSWQQRANKAFARPSVVPPPFVSIQTFDTLDEMLKAMSRK